MATVNTEKVTVYAYPKGIDAYSFGFLFGLGLIGAFGVFGTLAVCVKWAAQVLS